MNKKEKFALCAMIVRWEFTTGGSSSEAAARSLCAEDVIDEMGLTDDDLLIHRVYEMAGIMGLDKDNSDVMDRLYEMVEEDYRGTIDQFEDDMQGLIACLNA